MNKKVVGLALASCSFADAQQTGKIFRIGFLDSSTASGMVGRIFSLLRFDMLIDRR
jgi:hypothetical protein